MTVLKPLLLRAALACAMSFAVQATAHETAQDKKPQDMGAMNHSNASMQMHSAMDSSKMKMPMTGNLDRDFAAMMIMHHEQAIKMADIEIAHGTNAELKAMAMKMRKDQSAEIKKLKRFK